MKDALKAGNNTGRRERERERERRRR